MKYARNKSKERMASIRIAHADMSKEMYDSRNAMRRGTVASTCDQYGIDTMTNGSSVLLTARRDRLQAVVELLHYCGVNYMLVY